MDIEGKRGYKEGKQREVESLREGNGREGEE